MFLEQLKLFRLPAPPPEARTRHLLIGGRIVEYRLKRGAKRLSLTIDERGLRIGAPRGTSPAGIEAFVKGHGDWVLKKLGELAHASQPRHLTIKNGARLPLLGADAEVRVLPGANRVRWIADILVLEARPEADLARLATRALQQRALAHFAGRLAHYTGRLDLAAPRLGLSSAQTRWGSARSDGSICLNWRLLHFRPSVIDYVVVHELSHLRVMDHSPRFWDTVATVMPEYKALRRSLKDEATPSWE